MRLGDLDSLANRFWGKGDPYIERPKVMPFVVWWEAEKMAREAPTIDPESLPVVQELRAELAKVTAEKEIAVKKLKNYIEKLEM